MAGTAAPFRWSPSDTLLTVWIAAAAFPANPALSVIAAVGLWLIPGSVLTVPFTAPTRPVRAAASALAGTVFIYTAALALSAVSWLIGAEPGLLRRGPGTALAVLAVAGMHLLARRRDPHPHRWITDTITTPTAPWGFALLPAAALIAAGSGGPIKVGAVIIAVLAVTVTAWSWHTRIGGAGLFAGVLAVVWLAAGAGSGWVYGWDIQQETGVAAATVELGRWVPAGDPYAAMLSITAAPALLSAVAAVPVVSVLQWGLPALIAVAAVAMVSAARQWMGRVAAHTSVIILFAGTVGVLSQMPAITRQATAMGIVALGVLVATHPEVTGPHKQVAVGVTAMLVGVTHYTTAYLVAAMLAAAVLTRQSWRPRTRNQVRPTVTVNGWVAVAAIVFIIGWNGPLTGSHLGVTKLVDDVRTDGVTLFNGTTTASNPLGMWLASTAKQPLTTAEWDGAVTEWVAVRPWIEPVPAAAGYAHQPADIPAHSGVGGPVPTTIAGITIILSQLTLAAAVIALGWAGWRQPELLGAAVALIAIAAVVRVSGTVAGAYNPERIAAQVGMAAVIPFGLLIDRWGQRATIVTQYMLVAALSGAAWFTALTGAGVVTVLTGGNLAGAYSTRGENVDRFVVTADDRATVDWLNQTLSGNAVVTTDRYGTLALLGTADRRYGATDVLSPPAIDYRAWVFSTTANVQGGAARGDLNHKTGVWAWPEQFLNDHKNVVFTTATTRVHR